MEDENSVFIKEEPLEMNDMHIKDPFLCASQGPAVAVTSTPIKYESINIKAKNIHQSFLASRDELFISKVVSYDDLDNDTINRSFHIPPGSFLISRLANYEEGSDNISLRNPRGKVLISTPLKYEETFDEPNSVNQNNNTESNVKDVKIFPILRTSSKSFQCQLCTNTYTRKDHLTLHMRTHNGEKPFKCKQCDARFTYRHVLKHHELVHSGVKPFVCKLCGAGFTKKFNLESHSSRVHFKDEESEPIERKFKCDDCISKSVRRSALKVHERSHSSDKPIGCNTCGRKYKYEQSPSKQGPTHDMSNNSSKDECDNC